MPFKSEAQRRLFHAKAAKGEIAPEVVHEWEHATKNKKKLPMHVAKESSDDGYSRGAMVALAMFSEKAAAPINPAPVLGSAATQAATQLNPLASRVATSLVSGGTGAVLNAMMAPKGDRLRQGAIGFASDAVGGALGPWGMLASPAINMALQHFTAPKYEEKQADHADDRLKERIKADFPANTLEKLRAQAKELELAPGRYYLPLKDRAGNTAAIAAFKTVGPKDQLVLATVLAPKKNPPSGTSLSHLMKQPMGSQVAKVDASPKQYTIRENSDGRLTCTCKSFKFVHRAAGTNCKHIDEHLGITKESANKLEQFLLNQGFISEPQKTKLRGQFGRLTPKPTRESKQRTSQALALTPGSGQAGALRSMRSLLSDSKYPDPLALEKTIRHAAGSIPGRLKDLGGREAFETEYRGVGGRFDPTVSTRTAPKTAPAFAALKAGFPRIRQYAEGSPGRLTLMKINPKKVTPMAREMQLSLRDQPAYAGRQGLQKLREDLTSNMQENPIVRRATLEHEGAEKNTVLRAVVGKGKAVPFATHAGIDPIIRERAWEAKDPAAWAARKPGEANKSYVTGIFDKLYKQHGGSQQMPLAEDSRASRALNDNLVKQLLRAPRTPQVKHDLDLALTSARRGMTLHPQLEKALIAYAGRKKMGAVEEDEPTPAPPPPAPGASWLPTAMAGLLAGVGMYKFLRAPSFSGSRAFQQMQQKAVSKGFNRFVPVYGHKDEIPGMMDKILQPRMNAEGKLNLLNRGLLWALEGGEAIPYGEHNGKTVTPLHPEGGSIGGVSWGRRNYGLQKRFTGGTNLEGSARTQRAVASLALNKGREADLLQKNAPEAIPYSVGDLSRLVPRLPRGASSQDRYKAIRDAQANIAAHMGENSAKQFAIKPVEGAQSGGEFPLGTGKWNWEAGLRDYDTRMKDPAIRAQFRKVVDAGPGPLAGFLRDNKLHEGWVLDQMLKDPSKAMAQHWMPGMKGELRVHTMRGEVPRLLIDPRGGGNLEAVTEKLRMYGVHPKEVQDFTKNVLRKMGPKYQNGSFAMDLGVFNGPDGKPHLKVMELNPTGLGSSMSGAQHSGFNETRVLPWAGHSQYRSVTGRHTTPVALAGALGAGAIGAGVGRALTTEKPEEEDAPHPVG